MNEKISDERLEIDEHDIEEMLTSLDVCQKLKLVLSEEETKWITAGLRELLSARETIRRLVEVGRAMRNDVYAFRVPLPHIMIFNSTELWDAFLAELEGKGFETAMKRVLDENAGAWKALGGEEGKG